MGGGGFLKLGVAMSVSIIGPSPNTFKSENNIVKNRKRVDSIRIHFCEML